MECVDAVRTCNGCNVPADVYYEVADKPEDVEKAFEPLDPVEPQEAAVSDSPLEIPLVRHGQDPVEQ